MSVVRTQYVDTLYLSSLALCIFAFFLATPAFAQSYARSYATPERSDAAIGHYARTRALLVEALAEFEQGEKLASPEMLLDADEWRLSIISRTEELNRIIDPRPRVTRSGVRFQARGLRLQHPQHRTPRPARGAEASNMVDEDEINAVKRAEDARKKAERQAAREAAKRELIVDQVVTTPEPEKKVSFSEALPEEQKAPAKPAVATFTPPSDSAPIDIDEPIAAEETGTAEKASTELNIEDPEVAKAIEAVIQERLQELSATEGQAQVAP